MLGASHIFSLSAVEVISQFQLQALGDRALGGLACIFVAARWRGQEFRASTVLRAKMAFRTKLRGEATKQP